MRFIYLKKDNREYIRNPPIWSPSYLFLKNLSKEIKKISQQIKGTDLKLLDIGCGEKPYFPFFKDIVKEYIGLDVQKGKFVDVVGKAEELPFSPECFDIILCTQVLHHVDNPVATIKEIYRCLKKGGIALVSTHGIWSSDGGKWHFTKAGLQILFKDFTKVSIIPNCFSFGSLFVLINLYLYKLLKIPPYPFYLLNNFLGMIFDTLIKNEIFVVNYTVLATK